VVDHALRRFVEGKRRAVPEGDARVQLNRVVRLDGGDVGLIDLDGGVGERLLRVAALGVDFRLPLRFELVLDVGFSAA